MRLNESIVVAAPPKLIWEATDIWAGPSAAIRSATIRKSAWDLALPSK